jgi:hypothetical protein
MLKQKAGAALPIPIKSPPLWVRCVRQGLQDHLAMSAAMFLLFG